MKQLLILLLLFVLSFQNAFCQRVLSNGEKIKVVLLDGSIIFGSLSNMNAETLSIDNDHLGTLNIDRSKISSMFPVNGQNESVVLEEDKDEDLDKEDTDNDKNGNFIDYYNSTQYFVNQSAFSLKKGQKYYQNIGIFFNSFGFGITDNFDISVGGEVLSLFFASRFPVTFITPKYSFDLGKDKNALSIGTTFITVPSNDFATAGFVQSAITIGDRNNNFTIGGGIGFTFNDGLDNMIAPLFFSFMKRLGSKISLVSDNFLFGYNSFDDRFGLFSLSARIHFQRNPGAAFNVGLFRPTTDIGSVIAIPMVSALVPIGLNNRTK